MDSFVLMYNSVPTISTAIKVFHPKKISECHWYISNTNLEKSIILIKGQNSKFGQDNALWNLYVVAKISFF
jgi:hypothetical protein